MGRAQAALGRHAEAGASLASAAAVMEHRRANLASWGGGFRPQLREDGGRRRVHRLREGGDGGAQELGLHEGGDAEEEALLELTLGQGGGGGQGAEAGHGQAPRRHRLGRGACLPWSLF